MLHPRTLPIDALLLRATKVISYQVSIFARDTRAIIE